MLDAEIVETGENPDFCVVWLHGLGADGHDFVPIVPELRLDKDIPVRFIFPHAPHQAVTINGGYVMRAWYDIVAIDLTSKQDKDGILASEKLIREILDDQVKQGIAQNRIILAGFSQGGAMALHTGLRSGYQLAGIMALSCYLPLMDELGLKQAEPGKTPAIFMAHGSYDPVVPMQAGVITRRKLEEFGYKVEWHEYAMEHSVCTEQVVDIGKWLSLIISSKSAQN